MDKDLLKWPTMERNPCGEVGIERSDDENDEPNPYEAHSSTKSEKKGQIWKKAAFAANYGHPSHTYAEKRAKNSAKRLQELQRWYDAKPTSDAEELDLPSPRPAREKDDPNSAFKKKQQDKKMDAILNRHEKKSIRGHTRLRQVEDDQGSEVEDDMYASWTES
jgi:hypothetical protein